MNRGLFLLFQIMTLDV